MGLRDEEIRGFPAEDLVSVVGLGGSDDSGGGSTELVLDPVQKVSFRIDDEDSLSFFHSGDSNAAKTALAFIELPYGIAQVLLVKIWPHFLCDEDLSVV